MRSRALSFNPTVEAVTNYKGLQVLTSSGKQPSMKSLLLNNSLAIVFAKD
jgi:hypothetical protein